MRAQVRGAAAIAGGFPVTDEAVESLKFSACLPPPLAARALRLRGADPAGGDACLREPLRHVVLA